MDSKDKDPGTIFIVDDEQDVRSSLERFLRSVGYRVECFSSAEEFLKRLPKDRIGCVLLDIQMPGLSGLDLQQRLVETDFPLPIVFLTAKGDLPASVRAVKLGAENFLSKLAGEQELLDAVRSAVGRSRELAPFIARKRDVRERASTLTEREREICAHVIAGLLNKQIGYKLGIVERTVKAHRAKVMEKFGIQSVAELVRAAELAGIDPADPGDMMV